MSLSLNMRPCSSVAIFDESQGRRRNVNTYAVPWTLWYSHQKFLSNNWLSLARATPVGPGAGVWWHDSSARTLPVLTVRISTVVVNNINLTKLTTRTPHAIAAINYCLHHLYTWVSWATAALPTMSANCIPSELVCRAVTRPLFFHTGVARARL